MRGSDNQALRVGAGGGMISFGTTTDEKVGENGQFLLPDLPPDTSRLRMSGLPDGFYIKSVRMDEQEILESGLDLTRGAGGLVRITLSGKAGTIEGWVADDNSKPVAGTTVVLIPKSEKRRRSDQFYKSVNTNQQGRFTLKGVEPGEYTIYAWEDVEPMAWMDAEFVKPFESKGIAVTVTASGQHQLQLKVIPPGN